MGFEQNIANYFKFEERDATLNGELRAGLTTFLTMAYILIVNPSMLHNFGATGIPYDDALFATAIAAFVGCVVMGLWANLPFALLREWASTPTSHLQSCSAWGFHGKSPLPLFWLKVSSSLSSRCRKSVGEPR